jgi:predicted DNA-binding antitoxin AbrB/MazE fold protein
MKTVSKRQLVRNPALVSHLKPGQSLQLEDGKEPLVVSRPKRPRLTAEQIHAELDRLCEGAPRHDSQAALRDLRR